MGTYALEKNYDESKLLEEILKITKFRNRIKDNSIKKVIHVKNKIINIII